MTFDPDEWLSWQGVARVRAACEKQAANEGLSGLALFFRGQELFTKALQERPTYRQRQDAWRARQPKNETPEHPAIVALRAIAAGHNDPRRLANEVLAELQKTTP